MNANFTRTMDPAMLDEVLLTEPFRFLTRNLRLLIKGDPNALTVQLMSRNRLVYHHGLKSILTVFVQMQRGKPLVKCAADRDFKDHRLCSESSRQYRRVMRNWVGKDTARFSEYFVDYMRAVVKAVEPRYYEGDDQGNKAEGYWVNMAYNRFGNEWSKSKPLLVIDREFSLGFPQASEKKAFYVERAKPYLELQKRLQTEDRKKWGKSSKRSPKHEVGLLAVNEDGELVVIELRRGSNSFGICWAPMVAAMHRDVLTDALPNVSAGIVALIKQKIALGLLPLDAVKRIPENGFTKVSAAVAIADPQADDHPCWDLLDESIKQVEDIRPGESVSVEKIFAQG